MEMGKDWKGLEWDVKEVLKVENIESIENYNNNIQPRFHLPIFTLFFPWSREATLVDYDVHSN